MIANVPLTSRALQTYIYKGMCRESLEVNAGIWQQENHPEEKVQAI